MGVEGFPDLAWLDPPPAAHVEAAGELLQRLGALSASGGITPLGKHLARLPLHPRLGRLVVEAGQRGDGVNGCALAALLSADERLSGSPDHVTESDLLVLLDSEWSYRTKRLFDQIRRIVRPRSSHTRNEEALRMAVLAAIPDREGGNILNLRLDQRWGEAHRRESTRPVGLKTGRDQNGGEE